MNDITITRWKRYGNDRGYATAPDGTKLGWIDLKTGVVTVEAGADAATVHAALRAWSGASLPDPAPFDVMTPPSLAANATPAARGSFAAPVEPVEPVTVDDAFETLPVFGPSEPPPAPARPEERPATVTPQWTDLALHRPGELVRAEAAAKWEADKAESKLFAYAARFFRIRTDESNWRKGAVGEELVGTRLAPLMNRGWRILHSVPVGAYGSDIDHVVIGPGGVFTLNTKNHAGANVWVGSKRIMVNGKPVDHLRNSRHEAQRASRLLSARTGYTVEVWPVLAVIAARLTIKERPTDVVVVGSRRVVQMLATMRPVLTAEQIEAIYAVARRSDTWV